MRTACQRLFETMAATESLAITERWIRERLKLQHKCLADVRSLHLPGTYETGKIGRLGISLKNFVRLKTLDLSHNALVSVEGILHLKLLETLNLYYNRIASLHDVLALRSLQNLKELDLRLNPVVKKDPFYRLHLVHAISMLRKLDDCAVRDRERKAALMHFCTDTALRPRPKSPPSKEETKNKSSDLRIASVNRIMMSKLSFREGNEETALNHKSQWIRKTANQGAATEEKIRPESDHSPENSPTSIALINGYGSASSSSLKSRLRKSRNAETRTQGTVGLSSDVPAVTFAAPSLSRHGSAELWPKTSKNLTHNLIRAESNFTPHPINKSVPSQEAEQPVGGVQRYPDRIPNPVLHPPRLRYQNCHDGDPQRCSNTQKRGSKLSQGVCRKPMELLLSSVDEYWSGQKSDRNTKRFFTDAVRILCTMEQEVAHRESETKALREELQTLNSQLELRERDHRSEIRSLSEQLQQAQSDVGYLDRELRSVLEENVSLQKQLIRFEQQLLSDKLKEMPKD